MFSCSDCYTAEKLLRPFENVACIQEKERDWADSRLRCHGI